ncbi:MAG: hypothetical protein LUE29_06725 [Lachnospiraceae bacterium]|nr:hypothetical protein [Lachnospiraceae bacterium]
MGTKKEKTEHVSRKERHETGKKTFRHTGFALDCVNAALCIGVVILAVVILLDFRKYMFLFPILFLLATLEQFVLGVKYMLRQYVGRAAILYITGIIMGGITVLSMITTY